jgi:hypothetical protein
MQTRRPRMAATGRSVPTKARRESTWSSKIWMDSGSCTTLTTTKTLRW